MDKKKIIGLCEQILVATDNIVSVSAMATSANGPQLTAIQTAVHRIAAEANKPEEAADKTREE